jgi:hypothetical protein
VWLSPSAHTPYMEQSDARDDPRARFRRLPEPVRPEELVETHPADPLLVVETPADREKRQLAAGGGPV